MLCSWLSQETAQMLKGQAAEDYINGGRRGAARGTCQAEKGGKTERWFVLVKYRGGKPVS